MKTIDILIPTYNRASDLLANLNYLKKEIEEHGLQDYVNVIISDNCSTDTTQQAAQAFIADSRGFDIIYLKNTSNIGLEANVVKVLEKATSPFVMFCGDDDFIAKGYLRYSINCINDNRQLGCIIPGLKSIDKKGREVIGRTASYNILQITAGYQALLNYSHYAHQMSGLVLRREPLLNKYLSQPQNRNPYLFIFFTGYCLLNYPSIYAPVFKTAVQVANEKDWSYNDVGLLDEVFKSYYYFEGVCSAAQISELLIFFIRQHSYRLNIRPTKLLRLIRCWLFLSMNTYKRGGFAAKLGWLLLKEYLISFRR